MKVLIILLIVFVIYQIIRYLIILYNRSILPIYYSHGELVNKYAHYICNIDKNHCIIAIMDYKDTNITVKYLNGFRPYVLGDIVKISKFKNGIYYINPQTYSEIQILHITKFNKHYKEYIKKIACIYNINMDIYECTRKSLNNEPYDIYTKHIDKIALFINDYNNLKGCKCEIIYPDPPQYEANVIKIC